MRVLNTSTCSVCRRLIYARSPTDGDTETDCCHPHLPFRRNPPDALQLSFTRFTLEVSLRLRVNFSSSLQTFTSSSYLTNALVTLQ